MTDEQIRQQAINDIGVDVLETLSKNINKITDNVKHGHSNLAYSDIDMIVQNLASPNDRVSLNEACKMNRCSKYEILKLVKNGIIHKLKPIKNVFSKRDLQIAIREKELKKKTAK